MKRLLSILSAAAIGLTMLVGCGDSSVVDNEIKITPTIEGDDPVNIICYTRQEDGYSAHLGCSLHLAVEVNGEYQPIYDNLGVCYASGTYDEVNGHISYLMTKPYIFELKDGGYAVLAQRINNEASTDLNSKGQLLLFTTDDFITYEDHGLIDLHTDKMIDVFKCEYDTASGKYIITWKNLAGKYFTNEATDIFDSSKISDPVEREACEILPTIETGIEGAVTGNVISIPVDIANNLIARFSLVYNTAITLPENIEVSSAEELANIKATAVYSDGTTALKSVDWNTKSVDFSTPGTYTVTGTVSQKTFEYPVAEGKADPTITYWEGKYYFIATHEVAQEEGLLLRCADTLEGLFEEDIEEHLVLPRSIPFEYLSCFWAPEFHVIGGRLCILFAVSGEGWNPQSHIMMLKDGCDPTLAESWTTTRFKGVDGGYLQQAGITIDMTYFEANGTSYVMWTNRVFGIESGSCLYLATIDPEKPWQITSEPVLISRPLYSWENDCNTPVEEGPYAITHDGKLYIVFAASSTGDDYCQGYLYADINADLLDASVWTKCGYPILNSSFVKGEYGPGHSSFFTDTDGTVWYVYHGRDIPLTEAWTVRDTGIRILHWNIYGEPVLYLTAERELDPNLKNVTATITVK